MRETESPPPDTEIPSFPLPRAAGCPLEPPPVLGRLRDEAPITRMRWWDGTTPWLVTRHADQRALFADPRISADGARPDLPPSTPGFRESHQNGRPFIRLDDPEHARLRRMVTAPFSVKRSEALRPAVQTIVDGLIDDLLAGPKPADLVQAFALAVPSRVICPLLGAPYADHVFFQRNSGQFLRHEETGAGAAAAQRRLYDYLIRLLADKIATPGDDVLSDLARRVDAGELTMDDAARTGLLLVVAGHDTTANMITLGTLALLAHPDQLAVLRATDDPVLIADAVEELLRYLSIVHNGRTRVALADIEIGGHVIRAGEGVVLPVESANRDAAAFPDPDRLDLRRRARHHLAFAFGPHQCLGQNLARVELQVVYGTLYRRVPTLRLATGIDRIPFRADAIVYGVHELPVTW